MGFTTGGNEMNAIFVDAPGVTSEVRYTLCSEADTEVASGNIPRIDFTLFEVNDAADLAEVYPTNDDLVAGDLVMMDVSLSNGVKKSDGTGKNIL